MSHDPRTLQALLASAAPDLAMTFRPMFGGVMAYAEGRPFASLSNVGIGLKLAGAAWEEALALPGAEPLRYEPDSAPSKSYVRLPTAMHEDRATLRAWLHRSANAAPAPRPRRKGA